MTRSDGDAEQDEQAVGTTGLQLHVAHPALGVRPWPRGATDDRVDVRQHLGLPWMSLPVAEQELRARDFMRGLLRYAATAPAATFQLTAWADDASRSALRDLPGIVADDRGCRGPLTDAAIEALTQRPCAALDVYCEDRLFMRERSSPSTADREGVGIWIEPRRAARLTASLLRAWRPGAEERAARLAESAPDTAEGGRVSRETRARMLLRWERHADIGTKLTISVVAGTLFADTLLGKALVFAVLTAILLVVVPALLERWHRRS